MRAILESKRATRRELAALPFAEKVKLLEKLRDRQLAIAASPLARRFRRRAWPVTCGSPCAEPAGNGFSAVLDATPTLPRPVSLAKLRDGEGIAESHQRGNQEPVTNRNNQFA
jgi:hypothetical protein